MPRKIILVVDDEEDAQVFIENILDEDKYKIISAWDGVTGYKEAVTQKPDLIILDVQMPVQDGFTTYRQLKENAATSDIPIIMLTAIGPKRGIHFSQEEMLAHYGNAPAHYLEKPFDPVKLQLLVTELLG
ncbi:MAG: response regulator [Candidatus Cloacimonetes bacterium]|nr:response regulator [Candidatus Cloacimonadota bacterium]